MGFMKAFSILLALIFIQGGLKLETFALRNSLKSVVDNSRNIENYPANDNSKIYSDDVDDAQPVDSQNVDDFKTEENTVSSAESEVPIKRVHPMDSEKSYGVNKFHFDNTNDYSETEQDANTNDLYASEEDEEDDAVEDDMDYDDDNIASFIEDEDVEDEADDAEDDAASFIDVDDSVESDGGNFMEMDDGDEDDYEEDEDASFLEQGDENDDGDMADEDANWKSFYEDTSVPDADAEFKYGDNDME